MALIERFHVVATYFDVNPDDDPSTSPIIEGQVVTLDANSFVSGTSVAAQPMGLAGDTFANDQGHTPYADDIVINSQGTRRSTSNRASDFFDETAASSKITVYHGGGEFLTDQYASDITTLNPGQPIYADADGLLTATAGGNPQIGRLILGPHAYPSGVPGTDVEGSISLGDFVHFVLTI